MNSELIVEAARDTLAGTVPFPEIIGKLMAAGMEYYHVDYVLGPRRRPAHRVVPGSGGNERLNVSACGRHRTARACRLTGVHSSRGPCG
jgi:hypothetical protein